jgi:hypothetical protein
MSLKYDVLSLLMKLLFLTMRIIVALVRCGNILLVVEIFGLERLLLNPFWFLMRVVRFGRESHPSSTII